MGPPMDLLTDVTAWLRTEESFLLKQNMRETIPHYSSTDMFTTNPCSHQSDCMSATSFLTATSLLVHAVRHPYLIQTVPTPPLPRAPEEFYCKKPHFFERSGSSGVALLPNPPKRFDTFQWENTHFSTLTGVERSITKP